MGPVHYSQDPQIALFSNFFIKNRSHGTIHTFKNYFTTVFSVFNKISCIQMDPKCGFGFTSTSTFCFFAGFWFFFFVLATCFDFSTMNSLPCTIHGSHKLHFLATFSLKMGHMVLFTHLNIILLQCFQFSISTK